MGVYRTYFTKNNTLIKGKHVNTGQNPVTELFYGGDTPFYSRYIFNFDVSKIKELLEENGITNNATVKHTLKVFNTSFFENTAITKRNIGGRRRASSFDMILFPIFESWDEGTGYDFEYNNTVIDINPHIVQDTSNWFNRTTLDSWNKAGIYDNDNYNPINTQHFDLGNENVEMDMTELIQGIIINGTSTEGGNLEGFGLAFHKDIEQITLDDLYTIGFFTRNTNTFYEPFIETTWVDTVKDDRANFQVKKTNKLYLYVNVDNEPINLAQKPSEVIIYDDNGEVVQTITTDDIAHESKGVYSITLKIDADELLTYSDKWKGLQIGDDVIDDVEMQFTTKKRSYFNVGNQVGEPQDFLFNISGIQRGEKILKGETRKVIVTAKKMYDRVGNFAIDGLSYRIYVKHGTEKIEIQPKTEVNRGFNQNYFYLNTEWMIPQEYNLEFFLETNGTQVVKDNISFTIVK